MQNESPRSGFRRSDFQTTRWSVVVAAGGPQGGRREALRQLCESSWYPLYAYVRRRGYQIHDAQEITQAFFAEFLEKNYAQSADESRGRFRAFLLTAFKRFISKYLAHKNAKKRGGGQKPLSLDFEFGEHCYRIEPFHELTADRAYNRKWALMVLDRSLKRLAEEYEASGKSQLFQTLQPLLTSDSESQSYREIAASLQMTEGAVKVAAYRLRKRYQDLLRDEVYRIVDSPEEIENELGTLLDALRKE